MSWKVYLSIGSNLGDREKNLAFAYNNLKSVLKNIKSSSLFKTEPMYNTDQPEFLNAVFYGETDLGSYELLDYIHTLEDKAGRDRAKAGWKGPRPLDIDILLYGNTISDDPVLTIPHPGIKERGFVLIPLTEIAPDLSDPVTGRKYQYFIKNNMNFSVKYYKSSAIFDIIATDGR
ncbi:MAG: 2-amino-4-hydroxy-6-hydroxymethyldihydropteridine diphosphokinase [Spirochaetia bacterium]|nr:2-amino-4-hydroxy-6-hydroxymethyldihydropteridine diphosphokinase [Spirochaetia bacterium]